MRIEQFEFSDARRGPMAQLVWQRFAITCTEWPGTLQALHAADMLGPGARAEAEVFGPGTPITAPMAEPWTPAPNTCAVPGCGWPIAPCPYHPRARRTRVAPPPIVKTGEELRDEALDQVEANADPAWKAAAWLAVQTLARPGTEFTSDDIWDAVKDLPRPHEPRVMGAITSRASKAGLIEYAGRHVNSRDPVRHARPIPVWRGVTL